MMNLHSVNISTPQPLTFETLAALLNARPNVLPYTTEEQAIVILPDDKVEIEWNPECQPLERTAEVTLLQKGQFWSFELTEQHGGGNSSKLIITETELFGTAPEGIVYEVELVAAAERRGPVFTATQGELWNLLVSK